MESDEGTFSPTGVGFTGTDGARNIMKEIMKLLKPINVTGVFEGGEATDIRYWMRDGIPGERYACLLGSLSHCVHWGLVLLVCRIVELRVQS